MTEAIAHLTAHNIKPSAQRIAIMEYLLSHRTHPTVDMIYNDLIGKMPTLSRTTVYNTLRLLGENDAILELTIDKHIAHYDGDTSPHSHFQCKRCGRIRSRRASSLRAEFRAATILLYKKRKFTIEAIAANALKS